MEVVPDVGALLDAAMAGDIDRARELLGGVDVNADDDGFTALYVGATTGNWRSFKC